MVDALYTIQCVEKQMLGVSDVKYVVKEKIKSVVLTIVLQVKT